VSLVLGREYPRQRLEQVGDALLGQFAVREGKVGDDLSLDE
jgi:hypothetical protein